MGRPLKVGLDYFPTDVNIFDDDKIELVSAKFGLKSEAIIWRLLTKIYRNGYFIEWNEDIALLFVKRLNGEINIHFVNDVISELMKRKFFDEAIFKKHGILTSRGIQKRYVKACEDSKRKNIEIDINFDLIGFNEVKLPTISPITIVKSGINTEEIEKTPEESAQSKVKESKEKKSKGGNGINPPSLDNVLLYASQAGLPEDTAKAFYYHFQAKGWKSSGVVQRGFEWRSRLQQWYIDEVKQFSGGNGKKRDDKIPEFTTV